MRFYVDQTSPLRAIRLIRTPGFGGDFLHSARRTAGNSPARATVYAVMELLGRDPQLASATRAIGEVRRGSGRVLGLLGEAGLGKSALLAEIGERARAAGPAGRRGARRRARARRPLRGDVRRARRAGGRAGRGAGGRALPPPPRRRRRARAPGARRAAARRPALGRRGVARARPAPAAPARARAGACWCSRRGPSAPRAACWTPPAARPGWEQLELAPLEPRRRRWRWSPSVADAAVRERVVREGRGNPLFLRELARVADRADGALPASLVAAIGLEVAALGAGRRAR